jgi:uncharacterized protein YbcI
LKNIKKEMEKKISRIFGNFQKTQLGENADTVNTYLASNTLTIRSARCLAKGELKLMMEKKHWRLLKDAKEQEFEKVKPILKKHLEELTNCTILNIQSILGMDGSRLGFIITKENLEKKLL